jgi:signal transduction histidine kinase
MAPSARHLYPEWLRPASSRASTAGDPGGERQPDGAARVWERLRAFDRRYSSYVDVALAAVLFVLCSGWLIERGSNPNLWLVAALICPLVFRRRAPMTVFLVIAGVAFVQWLVSGPALADAALLVALFTVALESQWAVVVTAAVILEAGVVMATVSWTPTGNDLKSFVFLTGLAFAALLAGIVVRALRSQLDWLAERAQRLELERDQQASLAAATERARIAREMHDVVSHNIQVMVTLADAAFTAQVSDPARAREAMQEVSAVGRQALTDMRRMLGVLREDPSDASVSIAAAAGLNVMSTVRPGSDLSSTVVSGNGAGGPNGGRPPLAPQPGLRDLPALIERVRGTGLAVSLERQGRPFDVSGAAGLTAYRIVQEALTNALKHAHEPTSVVVSLEFDDPDLSVCVTDDGRSSVPAGGGRSNGNGSSTGAGTGAGAGAGGHGVAGMAERASAFGGQLEAGPRAEGGWRVRTTLRDCAAPVAL